MDTCTNPVIGYMVSFPDDWYTNTAIGAQAACAWFTPAFFEVDVDDSVPEEIWIVISLIEGRRGYTMLSPSISGDHVEVDGYAGDRVEFLLRDSIDDTEPDGPFYEYVVPLERAGPTLIASTDVARAGDYELAKAVLDRMMASMKLDPQLPRGLSIPSEPTGPLFTGEPVHAQDSDASFELTLKADQDRYRAGQEIRIGATLTYLGPEDAIVARGSGIPGLIGFAVESDDPAIRISPTFTTDCAPHEMARGVAVDYPMAKSGSYSRDDPNSAFYISYFASPDLRLPAGTWTITAGGGWYVADCGVGELHSLSASVTVVVEP